MTVALVHQSVTKTSISIEENTPVSHCSPLLGLQGSLEPLWFVGKRVMYHLPLSSPDTLVLRVHVVTSRVGDSWSSAECDIPNGGSTVCRLLELSSVASIPCLLISICDLKNH